MRTRRLGSDGPELSVVGFGAWAAGGYGWTSVDDDLSVRAIRRALDCGVNWIDTAAVYGFGHSEEVVGKAIRPYSSRDDIYVFTKCGLNWRSTRDDRPQRDLRPQSIRFECEQSLRRLGVEAIDLYQIHWPDDVTGTTLEDSWGTMAQLVNEGKVRWIGVSNFDVPRLERCEPIQHLDSLQCHYSLLNPSAKDEVIPWCAANGTGVIVYSPMESGLLTGTFNRHRLRMLDSSDWRRSDPRFQEPRFSGTLDLVTRLQEIAETAGINLPTLVIAWALQMPGVTGAIVGARMPEQVEGWLSAGSVNLSEQVLLEISAAIDTTRTPD